MRGTALGHTFNNFRLKNFKSSPKVSIEDRSKETNSIIISNKESKYRFKYGQEFKDMLEPRDQVLEHDFDFSLSFSP